MKFPLVVKNKTARSLVLASTLFIGLQGFAYAHEDAPDQDVGVQRPTPPVEPRAITREGATSTKNPNQGSSTDRDDRTTDRVNQNLAPDRNRSTDRPSQDGIDRSDGDGGGH